MKNFLALFLSLCLTVAAPVIPAIGFSVAVAPQAAQAQTVKIKLAAGQSNEMGYANRLQLAPVPGWGQTVANGWEGHPTQSTDSGVEYAHPTAANFPCKYVEYYGQPLADAWGTYLGQTPLASGTQERGAYGLELAWAWNYKADHPDDQLALIKVAIGGTSIENWLPASTGLVPADGSMWTIFAQEIDRATARLTAAGLDYEFVGMTWMQGENGCSTVYPYLNTPNVFKDKTRAFFAAVRAKVGNAEMPIALGRIGDQMLTDAVIGTTSNGIDTPENRRAATNWRRGLQVEMGGDDHCAWWDEDHLPILQSGTNAAFWYHHTSAGVLSQGERAYVAWQLASGETPQPPPPPLVLTIKRNNVFETIASGRVILNGQVVGGDGDTLEVEYATAP